jgi:GNAT superfamily N-acetyltransferase
MRILKYNKNLKTNCRSLWIEMVQHHRDIYNDPTIGGENPGIEFDQHLEKVGPGMIWVAELDSRIVGLAALDLNDQEGVIEPVIVSSGYRGKGIGKRLLNHVMEVAKELNIFCLSVKPVARNEGAISFFHQSGFKTLGHIQMFMWLGETTADMWVPGPSIFNKEFLM